MSISFLWAGFSVLDWAWPESKDPPAEAVLEALIIAPMTAAIAEVFPDEGFAELVMSFVPRVIKR